MGLTGLEVYKQLPKTNCKECGHPTCLAFAMALANNKVALDACPYLSEEARETLGAAAAPPMARVLIGAAGAAVELGGETELFRHDKRFNQPTAVACLVSDTLTGRELEERLAAIRGLVFHRVGQEYRVQMIAVRNDSGKASDFVQAAQAAMTAGLPLILMTADVEAMDRALAATAAAKPLIYAATEANYSEMARLALAGGCPLAVKARGLDALAALVDKVTATGCRQLVLDPDPQSMAQTLADFTQLRRLAIKKRFRAFGYPVLAFTLSSSPLEEIAEAAAYISKYANAVVLRTVAKAHVLPLLTWRQNLFTDPQVPIQVEQKINEVGTPGANSPVYVTTNFSLTYYSVQSEVENSRIPGFIIPVDTGGMSVLTAYADGRFTAETIARVMQELDIASKVDHRNIVIPGTVAVLKGKLEELTGWNAIVGPREAVGIPAFARTAFAN